MTANRRFFWILTLFAFLVTANGCATSRWLSVNEELERDGSGLLKESGQAITAYQLNDGPNVDFKGRVKIAAPDSLFFWSTEYVKGYSKGGKWVPEARFKVLGPIYSLDTVKALKVTRSSPGKTIPLVIFVSAALVALVVVATSLSNLSNTFN